MTHPEDMERVYRELRELSAGLDIRLVLPRAPEPVPTPPWVPTPEFVIVDYVTLQQ